MIHLERHTIFSLIHRTKDRKPLVIGRFDHRSNYFCLHPVTNHDKKADNTAPKDELFGSFFHTGKIFNVLKKER